MTSVLYAVIMGLLWIVNLFNGTGLDSVLHVTDMAKLFVIMMSLLSVLFQFGQNGKHTILRNDFIAFGGMLAEFCLSAYLHGYNRQAIDYLWVFGIVYLLSKLRMDEKTFMWTGLAYGIGGAFILAVYDYGSILKGWNENSIAMIGMHSYLIMSIPLFNGTGWKNKFLLFVITLLYAVLIYPTNSRSGILFMAVAALFTTNIFSREFVYGTRSRITLYLLVPLAIAALVVLVSDSSIFASLNAWSLATFRKPVFNGRDNIWRRGFDILDKNPLWGTGTMSLANWHNSAMTCLTAYGCLGFILWVLSFRRLFDRAMPWRKDYIIQGCIVMFMVLYLQQSVELGFISASPSVLPYVMLSMMLGRVKYLKQEWREGR